VTDEHSLARGEPVGFDDAGRTRDRHRLRAGDAGRPHDLLRERLRALDARSRRARPEHGDAAEAERVGDSGHERHLGADDDEIRRQIPGEL
jgi:hypothetical protein